MSTDSNVVPEKKNHYLEIETKYYADEIDRIQFKNLLRSMGPKDFLYVESTDIYYSSGDNFIRHRLAPETDPSGRSELTIKKKHVEGNNVVRTEINLRVDSNDKRTIEVFCKNLGYTRNFSIFKICDIYHFDDADVVLYTVVDEAGKTQNFLEIEVEESAGFTEEESRVIISKYEKLLSSLGLSPQKRLKRSLWEMYRKNDSPKKKDSV